MRKQPLGLLLLSAFIILFSVFVGACGSNDGDDGTSVHELRREVLGNGTYVMCLEKWPGYNAGMMSCDWVDYHNRYPGETYPR